VITYEYPLNERIRTLLRLEDLFERSRHFIARTDPLDHHVALLTLFEILEVAGRADLKSDLLQELERQKQVLLSFRNNPEISEEALSSVLRDIEQAAAALASAIEIEPNDVEARILLSELQIATNKIAAAKVSFRAAIDRAEAAIPVADAFAGWLVLRGDVTEAQELADRLIADAGDAETFATASAFERTVKRPDRAVAHAERAAKLGLPAGRRSLLLDRGG